MSQSIAKGLVAAFVFVVSAAAPASAQDDTHGVLGLGLSVLSWSDYGTLGKGFSIDVAHPVGSDRLRLRGVGDFGLWKDGQETDVTAMAGVRTTFPFGDRFNLDIQGLVGVAYLESLGQGALAFAAGPGVAIRVWINERVGVKAQVDYLVPHWTYGRLYRTWVGIAIGLPPG